MKRFGLSAIQGAARAARTLALPLLGGSVALVALGCASRPVDGSDAGMGDAASRAPASLAPAASALGASTAAPQPVVGAAGERLDGTSPIGRAVPALTEAVAALVKAVAGLGGQVGVAIVDVATGELLAAHNDRRMLNPASNAKLYTAAAALSVLHGNHRFETALYGEVSQGVVSRLVLRGHGDPSLSTRDLWDMVHDLRGAGARRVDGDILVDQKFFDESFVPPAFDQQPNEWAYFRAPVSAVSLDENTITMVVRPSAPDQPAGVSFEPPGFVDVDGTVKTTSGEHAQSVRLELVPSGARLLAHVAGTVPEGKRPLYFTRRADNPMLLAGYALKSMLIASGIAVTGDVKLGGERERSVLVTHHSRPLSELLYELGKQSDNFYAETIFKALGAGKVARPGRSADAADVVVRFLRDEGVFEEGTVVKNGSGLYDANRVSALETTKLLRAMYRNGATSSEYVAQLAIAGVDGTLHGRMRDMKDRRAVRAKTGTLDSIAALSGYVLAPPGKTPLAFSVLVNDVAGKVSGARAAIDQCVETSARYLWQRADGGPEARVRSR